MRFRSAPAQNEPPAPQSTAASAESSASKARKASASASACSRSTAFRASGRSSTTVVTGPSRSDLTVTTLPERIAELAPQELPDRALRDLRHEPHRLRHLVAGEPVAAMGDELVLAHAVRDHERRHGLDPGVVGRADDDRLANRRMR